MKITKYARKNARQLFRNCLVGGRLEETRVRQELDALLAQKPRSYLAIALHFQRLIKLHLADRTARVESAIPLEPGMADTLKARLTERHGPGLDFQFQHNSRLIGGLRVQVGSDVYDGSVRARLDQLAHQL
ncbi:MAG TPA: F0F1 ATP synthase subunit delta [Candidatus Paceibacterota bacterium]|nr:F0F1 ATP synthase subunit delta [Verrucomicrobiota bacterium]HRY51144.1 F0F1 ATP synthase subunit delta [Candidatus Paceibacterota bacterium]HSA01281.1 F0F1 ATP synthase subunit delta [Candidatus Paceibacterota bacterium]